MAKMCTDKQLKLCGKEECETCFKRSFASHEKSIHWHSDNILKPIQVRIRTHSKYKFQCGNCPHTFEISLNSVVRGSWCKYCCLNGKLCESSKDCDHCFKRSFASHEKSVFWHTDNKYLPHELHLNSTIKIKFVCDKCPHTFESDLNTITQGSWCPYCANNQGNLCENVQNCDFCFKRSFASHEKAEFWHEKNTLKPYEVTKYCNSKFTFNCDKCSHTFDIALYSIMNGSWCPFCGLRSLCDNSKTCDICYKRSFATHPKSVYWHKDNDIEPWQVSLHSEKKYKFNCDKKDHVFSMRIHHVTNGRWCSLCVYKTESKFFDFIQSINQNVIRQATFEWCKNSKTDKYFSFDFCIEKLKLIIEIDGDQHFQQVSNWLDVDKQHLRDIFKMKCALDNGYSIIRIYQPDILYDTFDWKSAVKNAIEDIENHFNRDIVTWFISKDKDIYKDFK